MSDRTTKTMKLGASEYSRVPERLKLFREDRANGKIETDRILNEDGSYEFTAWVWKDKTEYMDILKATGSTIESRGSADATGHAKGFLKDKKDFEKLETIAIGRALAILGYLASGEVASFEEMENYEADKKALTEQYIKEQVDMFGNAKNLDELKTLWASTNKAIPEILLAKDKRKAELEFTPKGKS